ncbi:NAD-binding protein [Litorivicinus lipolyticus]|uniref:NAD-binding protein n=1 Tax=Litorivicinus lipolyticus TaxID=418701 RepID=A0A5Q2QF85_9GAMM|nr:NAD(P)-dependent oxidoreductase [Litorivicinus lipolyticus]QGG79675.1 NAD-binding protein [Litorivicinus lipolyticus]
MTAKTLPTIGFAGLGLMGSAIVEHLQDLGYSLTVLGRTNRAPIDAAVARGAVEAKNGRDLASNVDVVLICVDTSKSVEAVMFGADGILEGVKPGTMVVDFGTSIPESTKNIGAQLEARGAHFMDAALGRTPAHAKDGLLNLMVGGSAEDFARMSPVFNDVGENVFHVGALAAGHTLKLINNFFGMTLATAMSEAFAIADVAGISRENLYNIMSSGPLHSPMMDFVKANAVDGDAHTLGFSIANARKDLGYYAAMVSGLNVPSFIGGATNQALTLAVAQGYGDSDVPVMVDFFQSSFANAPK